MADVTLGSGAEALRAYLILGTGDKATVFDPFLKAVSGDIVLKCTPATISAAATAAAWTHDVVVTLETADGEVHAWYNGPVTLAVADTSTAGTAAISPAAGAHNMTNGSLTVTLSGAAAAWDAAETATLTASLIAAQGLAGLAASATCVKTFT